MSDANAGSSTDQPELDLESDKFDPIAVVTTEIEAIKIPDPNAKTFNNLDEYKTKSLFRQLGILNDEDGDKLKAVEPHKVKSDFTGGGDKLRFNKAEREEELRKTLVPSVRKKKDQKSVLSMMNENVTGPMAFLFKCIGQQIRVLIRRRKIVYQNCEQFANLYGSLIAFDKHYNLILGNVREKINIVSVNNNNELPSVKRRQLKTVFIRGTNVILVSSEFTKNDQLKISSTQPFKSHQEADEKPAKEEISTNETDSNNKII